MDALRTTRTNVLERKLKDIESFTSIESKKVLDIPENDTVDELII